MIIRSIDVLVCDAGWRPWLFVKIETNCGIVGYSEVTDSNSSVKGLIACIQELGARLLGKKFTSVEASYWELYRATRQSPGGIVQKAIAGIENALWDLKAKSLGLPVYAMLGGPIRTSMPVYWSHCGTTRVRAYKQTGCTQVATLDDLAALGEEVVARGYSALKTNVLLLGEEPRVYMPGTKIADGLPDQTVEPNVLRHLEQQISTLRTACGPDTKIMLDLNFNFKPEAALQIARRLEPFDLYWLEIDCYNAQALAGLKARLNCPLCSGENLYTTKEYLPYLQAQSMSVVMIDIPWNGLSQSRKIADMAEAFELNVAPHNYYSHLATAIGAHFAALVPNLQIYEVDVDDVPWKDELVDCQPEIVKGELHLSDRPGWGMNINEAVVAAHPWNG